jgi:hypothetical protein
VNRDSVGIELFQGSGAELYEGQLEAARVLIDALTVQFGIQRQIPDRYRGALARFDARDAVGVIGHRDVSQNRGAGDPGDAIFDVLAQNAYERFDFAAKVDQVAWRERQRTLGLAADGIPGPKTCAALRARGYAGGLWACPPVAAPSAPVDVVGKQLDELLPAWAHRLGSEAAARAAVVAWAGRGVR